MRPEERLLCIMDQIPDAMLEEALEAKRVSGDAGKRILFGIAAAACIFALFLCFVPAGQAMAAKLQQRIERLLEELFPPREITVAPEGEAESGVYEVFGKLPASEVAAGQDAAGQDADEAGLPPEDAAVSGSRAGFAIYYDRDSYETVEGEGGYVIRPKRITVDREEVREGMSALLEGLSPEEAEQRVSERMDELQGFYDSLPSCEICIVQRPDVTVEEAAREARQELLERCEYVSEAEESGQPAGLYLHAYEGTASDSGVEDIYFVDDGSGGVFTLTARYFMEAAEGHGVRLRAMISTFEVLPEQEPGMRP